MEGEQATGGFLDQVLELTGPLAEIDPQYLVVLVGLLIWVQLGRIARALKDGGGLPKDLPARVDNLQARVQALSHDVADFQSVEASRRRTPASTRSVELYPDKTG